MINFERLIYMRQPFLRKVLTGILMRELSQRTSQFTDSVIRRMTRVANKYGAVNLSQGFPDFEPPKAITDRLARVAGEGPHPPDIPVVLPEPSHNGKPFLRNSLPAPSGCWH